jgi:hypothetical protein
VIEKFKTEHTKDIINICYRTGFYGGDLSGKKIFGDKKLFAMRFVLHYIRFQPEYCFVYKTDGKVVGYIVGTDNTKKQEINFFRNYVSENPQKNVSVYPVVLVQLISTYERIPDVR